MSRRPYEDEPSDDSWEQACEWAERFLVDEGNKNPSEDEITNLAERYDELNFDPSVEQLDRMNRGTWR
jgi:hypothetical protein